MEYITKGWIDTYDGEIILKENQDSDSWRYDSLAEKIIDYFGYINVDSGLGKKITIINNASLQIWFADEQLTLEETQMNFESYLSTGTLLTSGSYVGYSEYTITGFSIEDFIIGGHDLNMELRNHIGEYCHFILSC